MAKTAFVNQYGASQYLPIETAQRREYTLAVVIKQDMILCQYDRVSGLYSFPDVDIMPEDCEISFEFSVEIGVMQNATAYYDKQNFKVYRVEDAQINSTDLCWQKYENILVNKIMFDATHKNGFKNLLVRMKK